MALTKFETVVERNKTNSNILEPSDSDQGLYRNEIKFYCCEHEQTKRVFQSVDLSTDNKMERIESENREVPELKRHMKVLVVPIVTGVLGSMTKKRETIMK